MTSNQLSEAEVVESAVRRVMDGTQTFRRVAEGFFVEAGFSPEQARECALKLESGDSLGFGDVAEQMSAYGAAPEVTRERAKAAEKRFERVAEAVFAQTEAELDTAVRRVAGLPPTQAAREVLAARDAADRAAGLVTEADLDAMDQRIFGQIAGRQTGVADDTAILEAQ